MPADRSRAPTGARTGALLVFSPLPPERNGIADYMAELLAELRRRVQVLVVVDDCASPTPIDGVEILPLSAYQARHAELQQLPHVYQLGNNIGHVYMLATLMQTPGVVVLHDISLHHLVDQATLRYGDEAGYARWLGAEHGRLGQMLAQQFRQHHWRGESFYREMPMLRVLLRDAGEVVVHSRYAARKVRAQLPQARILTCPHHVSPAALAALAHGSRQAQRRALGVADDTVLVVSLGFVTRAKQIGRVLDWLHARQVRATEGSAACAVRYAIVGQAQADEFDVESRAQALGLSEQVSLTGYADERRFFDWILAADVVVNLRYPSGGETSGVFVRALAMGACVVVSDLGPFAEYPDTVCCKVPSVPDDDDRVFRQTLDRLVTQPERRQRLGIAARHYMARTHRLEQSASQLLAAAGRLPAKPAPCGPINEAYITPGAQPAELPWLREARLPLACTTAPAALLVGPAGAKWMDRCRKALGYAETACTRWCSLGPLWVPLRSPRQQAPAYSARRRLAQSGTTPHAPTQLRPAHRSEPSILGLVLFDAESCTALLKPKGSSAGARPAPARADALWAALHSRMRWRGALVVAGLDAQAALALLAALARAGFEDGQRLPLPCSTIVGAPGAAGAIDGGWLVVARAAAAATPERSAVQRDGARSNGRAEGPLQ